MTANESHQTIRAVRDFLKAELDRRKKAGETGGRAKVYKGDAKERNREAVRRFRAKKKTE